MANKYKFQIGDKVIGHSPAFRDSPIRGTIKHRERGLKNVYFLDDMNAFFFEDELRLETISYMKGRKANGN